MDSLTKAGVLSNLLAQSILPRIEQDYVLYGLPFYSNIGDSLIWEGELSLLKKTGFKCKSVCGWNDYPRRKLPDDVCMLIQGGGYFGDLWRDTWEWALNEIALNYDRRIILFPMSIWYDDKMLLENDIRVLAKAKDLTIFVRDRQSFDFATSHFDNEIQLAPDMAFAIVPETLSRWSLPENKDYLFLKREDKEFVQHSVTIPSSAEVEDWPTFSSFSRQERIAYGIEKYYRRLHKIPMVSSVMRLLKDLAYCSLYREQMVSRGVQFLSQYRTIFTSRLHGMVLASLLGKNTYFVDNSSGKVSSFYQTWLSDVDNINPAPNE